MFRLFYGVPGAGKTASMVGCLIPYMYGEKAIASMHEAREEAEMLNANGYNVSLPQGHHLVYTYKVNIKVKSPDFGLRKSYEIDPAKLGIASEGFAVQYLRRGSVVGIDEIHRIADSRFWSEFVENSMRWWEEHRKHNLTIFGTCQDPSQVEKRIRQLGVITQVVGGHVECDKFGNVVKTVWNFENWSSYESWSKGTLPTKETYSVPFDISKCYNTYEGEESFYAGLDKADFHQQVAVEKNISPQSVAAYMAAHPVKKEH